jgi:hypothetical protein
MKPEECVLFSGAAKGAEAAFGAAAEKYGVDEVNFTFEGHPDARKRGIRVLTHEELEHGDVSLEYVSRLMHRQFKNTRLFKKVLQTIWHQINNAQEIYVVGRILDDKTVKGGTKLCNKPLFVYDQDAGAWHHWTGSDFEKVEAPTIAHPHFCGTGTRHLNDAGAAAIEDLFARSFG